MPLVKIKTNFRNKKLYPNILPEYAFPLDSGMDLRADIPESEIIRPSTVLGVPTGLSVALSEPPEDETNEWVWELQIRPRSGLAARYGITVVNSPGTVDTGYTGELKVLLLNTYLDPYVVNPGDRIAQLVLSKSYRIQWQLELDLPETDRNSGGFGSTGKK